MIENEKQSVEYFNKRSLDGLRGGWGSVGAWAELKVAMLQKVWPFKSMLDIGCGDMVYLSSFEPFTSNKFHYLGIDGSEDIIRKAEEKYSGHNFREAMISELVKINLNQKCEVIACYDVLFHIVEDNLCDDLIRWMFDSSARVIVMSFLRVDEEGPREGHFIIRDFGKVSIPNGWKLELEKGIGRKKRQKVAMFIR